MQFKESSLAKLNNVIKKVVTGEHVIVGTYIESDFLDSQVLSDKALEVNIGKDYIDTKLWLKPLPSQIEGLKTFDSMLIAYKRGYFIQGQLNEPNQKSSVAMDILYPHSGMSNIQDIELALELDEPRVTSSYFTIKGQKYMYFKVGDYMYDPTPEAKVFVTLHLLFKQKTMDLESIFSAIRGDLNKTDTVKVLSLLGDNNVTGMFIGGVRFDTAPITITAYAMDSVVAIWNVSSNEVEGYSICTDTTKMVLLKDYITGGNIKYIDQNRYEVTIKTKDDTIVLFLG